MKYYIQKIYSGELELLPDVVDTPIWEDFDEVCAPQRVKLVGALYQAIAERDNYFQFNTPTAFDNPDYSRIDGIAIGIKRAAEIEEYVEDDKRIFKRRGRIILIVDKIHKHRSYYEAVRENREALRAMGF